jgi:hypothetical protein
VIMTIEPSDSYLTIMAISQLRALQRRAQVSRVGPILRDPRVAGEL